MFGKEDEKGEIIDSEEVTGFIGKGMEVEGKVSFEGTVRVDGKFKGEIRSNGMLHVGEGALVEAELNVDKAVISGEVRGTINAVSRVELKAPGKVFGDVKTPTLIVGEGVIFEGNCVMTKKTGRPVGAKSAGAKSAGAKSDEARPDTGDDADTAGGAIVTPGGVSGAQNR